MFQEHPGWREIWPNVWLDAVIDGLDELLSGLPSEFSLNDSPKLPSGLPSKSPPDLTSALPLKCCQVSAIGFTGQMHTTVFLDQDSKCIRPAIMWNDMRSKDSIAPMKEAMAGKTNTRSILKILSTGSLAANLLWLKEHEPEHFKKLRHFLIGPDYLVYCFAGKYSTDYCEASTSSLYDTEGKRWLQSMRAFLSLPETAYPPIRGSQETVGCLSEMMQCRLGLPATVQVIVGTGDNPVAAVATGALKHRYPVLSIGTSGVLVVSRGEAGGHGKGKQILFSLDGKEIHTLVQGVVQSADGSYNWYVKHILGLKNFDSLIKTSGMDNLKITDLLFYPHLTGDKTIYSDPGLRGALIGLDINHSNVDIAVAVMEGVCFAVKQLIQEMQLTSSELQQLKVTGGGSYSQVWMQIMADILGIRIEQLDGGEGAAYGVAIMARGAAFPSEHGHPGNSQANIRGRFETRPSFRKLYAQKYKKYLKIYDALNCINL